MNERRRGRAAPPDSVQGNTGGYLRRGRAGVEQAAREREDQARRAEGRGPMRFWLKEREQAEIIVLDASLDDCVFAYEHAVPGPGMNWKQTEEIMCARDVGNCALCDKVGTEDRFRRPYYAMFMSVLDTRSFTVKRGPRAGQTVEGSRKLLVVKTNQISDFARLEEACRKNHGTMRGMVLTMEREPGQQSSRIGKPVIMDNGAMFDMEPEANLLRDYGNEAILEGGKVVRPENVNITPFDYDVVFPMPDPDELARRFGGVLPQGGAGSNSDAWEDEDDQPEAAQGSRRGRGRASRTRAGAGTATARGRASRAPAGQSDIADDDSIPF